MAQDLKKAVHRYFCGAHATILLALLRRNALTRRQLVRLAPAVEIDRSLSLLLMSRVIRLRSGRYYLLGRSVWVELLQGTGKGTRTGT